MQESLQIIVLNIRGLKYEVILDRLEKCCKSRLYKLRNAIIFNNKIEIRKLCDRFNDDLTEFYFNRDPFILNQILNFYETDTLHLNHSECATFIQDELNYWGIDENLLEDCCKSTFYEKLEQIEQTIERETHMRSKFNFKEDFGTGYIADLREKIWDLFDDPHSSVWAKVYILKFIVS
jgi:hypothetical protein